MTKQLEIIIDGKLEGRLEIDETGKEEIKVIQLELPEEIQEQLHMGMFSENVKYMFTYGEYIKTVQHGMEHYLDKKVELVESQTSPSYSQKI